MTWSTAAPASLRPSSPRAAARAGVVASITFALVACGGGGALHPQGGDGGAPVDAAASMFDGSTGPVPTSVQVRSCGTTFTFHPDSATANLFVAGEWNGFDPLKGEMAGPDKDGNYSRTEMLAPGAYAYKIVKGVKPDQTWMFDPSVPYTKWVGGVENSVVEVEDCHAPLLRFVALDKTADGTLHAEADYVDGADKKGFDKAQVTALLDGAPAPGFVLDGKNGRMRVDAQKLAAGKHRLTFSAVDRAGKPAVDLHVPFWIEAEPFDFRDGVMYFAFTDRFKDGDPGNDAPVADTDPKANYQGGDFAGITQVINDGYFDALGVRTIWISPPNANPSHWEYGTEAAMRHYSGYHGYWPVAGRTPDKHFGDLAQMRTMIQAAHAHGIRVLVDTVLNHVHKEHPYYVDHKGDGWFNGDGSCVCGGNGCDWDTHRLDCWFTSYLPDIDYHNYAAVQAMTDDALFWARELDVDGFRVDAVKHFLESVPRRLRGKLHEQLEHAGPLYYTVGETFDGDRNLIYHYVGPTMLHAQFDFPLYFAIRGAFADGGSLRNLAQAVTDGDKVWKDAPMSPFLGNHDVTRFLSEAGGSLSGDSKEQGWNHPPGPPGDGTAYEKLRLALAFVLTQPGVPLLYYGDEVGLPGAGDPDNRRMMKWSGLSPSEQATLDFTKKVGAARRELLALRRGGRWEMWQDDDLYVYARGTAAGQVAVVAINRGQARSQMVQVRAEAPLADGTVLNDRLGGPPVTVQGGMVPVSLGTRTAAVWAP